MEKTGLSVRKQRELDKLLREDKIRKDRIKLLQQRGTADPAKLIAMFGKDVAKAIEQAPADLMRKVVAYAVKVAIPKSPRGRKPSNHTA